MTALRAAPGKTKVKGTLRLPRKVKIALADFQRRALELFPDDILAIILYGSYARGEATPDSDVDVLMVGKWADPAGNDFFYSPRFGDPRWEKTQSAVNESMHSYSGPHLSVTMFDEREFNTNLPLIHDAKREGIVLWQREEWIMSEKEEEHPSKPYDPQTWIEMAEKELKETHQILDMGLYRKAVSSAYYAMFYAARAALLTKGLFLKKHSAANSKLKELLVNTGELEERYVTYLGQGQDDREQSDYTPYILVGREKAVETLEHAEEFITKMKELIGGKQGEK